MARVVATVLVVLMLGVGVLVYVQLDQPVSRVVVRGQLDSAERDQIRSAVRAHLNGGLLSADLHALSDGILTLEWPRSISIRRDWPDTLQVEVEKPAVIARWRDAYLASDGGIVRLPADKDGLPRFDCSSAEPRRAMEIFHRLNEASSGAGLTVEVLRENPLGEWEVTFRTADSSLLAVKLGAESVQERLQRFLVVYRQHLAERLAEIAAVDARYDNGIAVSWLTQAGTGSLVATADAPRSESI